MEDTSNSINPVLKGNSGGLAGLQNSGNTYFMSSSLQCLVHTPPLVEYLLEGYTDEINEKNPLGMHGELAIAFGELLGKIWSSGRTSIAPREFKGKPGRFAPQFSVYNQHDSRGQYKSTLVCPDCKKISIAFDPFMYASLPLPSTATQTMTVSVFYGDDNGLPMPYSVTVLKNGACRDLKLAMSLACCLKDDEDLLLAEVYEHTIYRYLEVPLEPLSSIKDNKHIVAYMHPKTSSDSTKLEICHRYLYKFSTTGENVKPAYGGEEEAFLRKVVTPIYEVITPKEADRSKRRKSKHSQ